MYGLRKITKDGKNSYNNFVWPLEVGAEVEAPDWNPEPKCGGGLHCLLDAQGGWPLLNGYYWAVLEFDEKDMVLIDGDKCKVRKCKIVFLSKNPEGLEKFFDFEKFDSQTAFYWAKNIGDRKQMIDKIAESGWAYYWSKDIGNREQMIDKITESEWAYYWARCVGDKEQMIAKFPEIAYQF